MNYKKIVPEDSFIGQYMKYMSVVETAESYDFWCGVWALGTGVGRDVYVDRPNSPVYHNWYIILAAEAGVTRKSTAISSISNVVKESYPLLTGRTSPESLELLLHERTTESGTARAHFAVSELVTILGKEGYMSTMPGLLTDLYDCHEVRRIPGTLKSGELIHKNVYVSFISASTPSWLVTAINPTVIEGGFTSRVIFVVDDNRKRAIAWPERRREGSTTNLKCLFKKTTEAARDEGAIRISEGGLRKFRNWYNRRANHVDPFLSSFEAREDDHVLRLASTLSINDGTLELHARHISSAIGIINRAKSRANQLFGGDFSQKARISGAIERVREILIESGTDGIKHSDLQRRVVRHVDVKELKVLMNILHECGMIQIFKVGRGTFYRATRTIEKFGVLTEVLSTMNLEQELGA
tara:strand:+ start:8167 stop:9402 length:1236 start_codon:yes stop_codon:yes gene_type:complete